jgi:acetyl esterase/lipase
MTIFRSYASCLAFWVGASVAACVGAAEPAPPLPLQKGIVYRQVAGQTLRLDLARPAQADGPLPAIICIHGGGWSLGYRGALHPFVQYFAQRGYVTVTIDYRLSPRHRFPAHIEDVKAAIRFLRKQAGQYGIDPQRIGTLGFSAGGHLALLAATTGPDDGLDGEHEDAVSSQVQAAVNYFGSVNFQTWRMTEEGQQRVRRNYKGKSFEEVMAGIFGHYDPQAPIMRQASPATYLDPADPPICRLQPGRGVR